MKSLLPLPLLIFFLSCGTDGKQLANEIEDNGRTIVFNSFPNEISLSGSSIGPVNYFFSPEKCIFSRDYILVFDTKSEHFFHILNSDFQVTDVFGKQGDGPYEMAQEPAISPHDFISLGAVYLYNFAKSIVEAWKIDTTGHVYPDSVLRYELPNELYNVQKVAIMEKEKMIGLAGMQEGKLYFFDPGKEGDVLITPFYPELDFNPEPEFLAYKYLGYLAGNHVHRIIVCANTYFPQLEIYNWNGKLLKETRHRSFYVADNRRNNFAQFNYYSVQIAGNYIYALYLGEIKSNILKSTFHLLKSKIHVFDLEGKPVMNIKLDKLLNDFLIDEPRGRIIGIDENNESQPFVTFELPKTLK